MAITLRGSTASAVGSIMPVPDTDFVLDVRDLGSTAYMYVWCVSGSNPEIVGSGYNFGSQAYITTPYVHGDYVYVTERTGSFADIWILDISALPTVTLEGYKSPIDDGPYNNAHVTDGNYLYIAHSSSYSSYRYLTVWDITDKSNPFKVGTSPAHTYWDYITRLRFHPIDPNYIMSFRNNTGVIGNVTNKSSPTNDYTWAGGIFDKAGYYWFETAQIGASGYCFAGWGNYGAEIPGGIQIINITNPNPATWTVVGELDDSDYGTGYGYHFGFMGNYIYTVARDGANYWITMTDVSDLSNPIVVDSLVFSTSTNMKETYFMTTTAGDPIIVVGDQGSKMVTYDVPVAAYQFAGSLTDDAEIRVIDTNTFNTIRKKSFSAGSYSFPSVTDTTPRHVMAERDSDGALLIYADVTPSAYSSS